MDSLHKRPSVRNFSNAFEQTAEWIVKRDKITLMRRHSDVMVLRHTYATESASHRYCYHADNTSWRYDMKTLTTLLGNEGTKPVTRGLPHNEPVSLRFGIFLHFYPWLQ